MTRPTWVANSDGSIAHNYPTTVYYLEWTFTDHPSTGADLNRAHWHWHPVVGDTDAESVISGCADNYSVDSPVHYETYTAAADDVLLIKNGYAERQRIDNHRARKLRFRVMRAIHLPPTLAGGSEIE